MSPVAPVAPTSRQRGTSAIEFIVVAVPMLLVGLGAIELGRWFSVKQAVSLALLEAGRAGITDHARPSSIEHAFERALLPMFPPTRRHTSAQRLAITLERRRQATGAAPWQIQVVSPDTAAYTDFSSKRVQVANADGYAVIDNNYQAEQHEAYVAKGWEGGRGPISGVTIFDANSLVLHLTYPHEPLVPGMNALLALLSVGSSGYARAALAGGYLPLRQTIRLSMQSHPVAWPNHSVKVLIHPAAGTPPAQAVLPCVGLWCRPQAPASPASEVSPPWVPSRPFTPVPGPTSSNPVVPAAPGPGTSYSEECGVLLCCMNG